ncbi:unnamed protein product [Caenorhabditis auriculariae]|uniref:Uncharacterized protein n=1 Tax=Caenorhabditis auriculariae TaxID=2777116 RepID=A0A8S1H7M4_9PELO|nr:unnamed protein product [Caenorhabditis auriculariae]
MANTLLNSTMELENIAPLGSPFLEQAIKLKRWASYHLSVATAVLQYLYGILPESLEPGSRAFAATGPPEF